MVYKKWLLILILRKFITKQYQAFPGVRKTPFITGTRVGAGGGDRMLAVKISETRKPPGPKE